MLAVIIKRYMPILLLNVAQLLVMRNGIGVRAGGGGGAAAPPVAENFEIFGQNADDSGKSTREKAF